MGYVGSYIWTLRRKIGHQELLVPGAQVLLVRDGTAVFQRRGDSGEWEIPAGSAEPGQSFVDAAIAEVHEEIGIVVRRADLVPFATFSDPVDHRLVYPSGDVVHAFALCLAAHAWSGVPTPDRDEVIEWGSFDVDCPPSPLRLTTRRVLALYREFLRTGEFQAG
jgi:8-oxo-dGTP pyrophosphatase MutT (NUDIX family)